MAVKRLFTNNAVSLLQAGISASATTLNVIPGHGAMFPSPGANEIFVVTLENQSASLREIVHVTARNNDTFTIVRGQEGTTPLNWPASSGNDTLVDHRVTAGTLYYLKDELQQAQVAFADLTGAARDNASLNSELDNLSDQIDTLAAQIANANDYSNANFPSLTDYKSALDYLLAIPPTDLSAINSAISDLQDDTASIHGDIGDLGQEIADIHTQIDNSVQPLITDLQNAVASNNDYVNPNFASLTNFKKALDYILAQPLGAGSGGGTTMNLYSEKSTGGVATAVGNDSLALGAGSEARANDSIAIGDQALTRLAGITYANGRFGSQGDAQVSQYLSRTVTVNASETELFMDGTNGSQRLVLPDDSTWNFEITIVAHQQDGNGHAGFRLKGIIYKAGSVNMLGAVSKETITSPFGWDANVLADGTNNSLKITATGEAGKIIRWLAFVNTVEVTN